MGPGVVLAVDQGPEAVAMIVTKTSDATDVANGIMLSAIAPKRKPNHQEEATNNNKVQICHPDGGSCQRTNGLVVTNFLSKTAS